MRGSIQVAIMFLSIQALLGQFPYGNNAPEAKVNSETTAYGQG